MIPFNSKEEEIGLWFGGSNGTAFGFILGIIWPSKKVVSLSTLPTSFSKKSKETSFMETLRWNRLLRSPGYCTGGASVRTLVNVGLRNREH